MNGVRGALVAEYSLVKTSIITVRDWSNSHA